jgi:hypothetical protein
MTHAHTPGPWVVLSDDDRAVIVGNARTQSTPIVEILFDEIETFAPVIEEAIANARLIAAAPDLMAALERLVANLDEGDFISTTRIDDARAAIAKAKGLTE